MSPRKLFVTTALPYANGKFHIGHIMEYIQADIWVRFQRMQGAEVNFVCADDAHGAAITIAADKAGITPQAFVAEIAAGRKPYLDGFHIAFDNWSTTDSPENHQLAQEIYRDLRDKAGLVTVKTVEQFYDVAKGMFLADRFIKGECPVCHSKDQYGDNCEVCGAVYAPTELIDPYSVLSGVKPELRSSEHFFFKLSDPRCEAYLKNWTTAPGHVQTEVQNKIREWLYKDEDGNGGLGDWDISRDAPYFGIEIPDAPGKYFYVWLDAPVGYLASLKNLLDKRCIELGGDGISYTEYMADPDLEQVHFIGKDIITFHTLFWPAMLHFSGRKTPDAIYVHGHLTVSGEKMSKSRGTGIDPLKYLSVGLNPEWLRYYLAAKLNGRNEDLDFNPDDFVARVNSDLVGKYINIASRAAGFIGKRFGGKLGEASGDGAELLAALRAGAADIARLYDERDFARALRDTMALADRVNAYVDANKPWELAKKEGMEARLHDVCTVCIEAFRLLTLYLKPVLPALALNVEAFLAIAPLTWPGRDPLPPAIATRIPPFAYVPGYLGFREAPALVAAWASLPVRPDLLLVDGHGRAHPRRCGIATHLGVLLDTPTVGVAKSILCGRIEGELGEEPGATAPLVNRGEIVAMAVRTRARATPVYVGTGHRVSIKTAVRLVLSLTEGRRLPLPIRLAHDAANAARRTYAADA